ncbi:MAG: O-antigen ligase family protein [Oscillospiraceae bacterium]|jgi:O-antigen ligase|nr:O-antigen ligase family protein [Oscillospiraceae bacterium]
MSKYIKPKAAKTHKYLAIIALFLLLFNALQGKLTILLLRSPNAIAIVQAFAVLLLIVYMIVEKHLSPLDIRLQWMDVLFLMTVAVMLITTEDYSGNLSYVLRYCVLVIVVIVLKYDESLMEIAIKFVILFGAMHVFFTLWFYFDKNFYLSYIYPTFTTLQKQHLYDQVVYNGYATGLADHYSANGINISLAACVFYVCFFKTTKKVQKVAIALGFAVALVTLFMTGKRGALVFALAAMLFTYVICNKDALNNKIIKLLLIVATSGVVVYLMSFYIPSIGATIERILQTIGMGQEVESDVSNGRFELYTYAWNMFLQNPILGIGWREYTNDVSIYYHDDSALRDAHNVFLQLLCETGIVGFLVFVTLFVSAFVLTVYVIRQIKRCGNLFPAEYSTYMAFSICFQTYFLLYCMTGNPLYDMQTVYVYILAIGFSACIYYRNKDVLKQATPLQKAKSKYLK